MYIKKKAYEERELSKKVIILKKKTKRREKKTSTAKFLKELYEELQSYLEKIKDPVTTGKAIQCTADIFPDISLILIEFDNCLPC